MDSHAVLTLSDSVRARRGHRRGAQGGGPKWMPGICAAAAVFAAVVLGACGSSSSPPRAQPAPDVTVFRTGGFDQLPRYPRTQEVSQQTSKSGVVSQSFSVSNTTPEQVLQFYSDHLVGWQVTEPVHAVGTDVYRGAWVKGDRELLVTSSKAPTISNGEPAVEYSLELGPIRPLS